MFEKCTCCGKKKEKSRSFVHYPVMCRSLLFLSRVGFRKSCLEHLVDGARKKPKNRKYSGKSLQSAHFLLRDRCGRLGIARVGVCCVWGSGAGGHRRRGWARPRSAAPEVTARVSKPQTMPIPSLLRRHFPHRAIQTGVMTRTRCFHPVVFFYGCWLGFVVLVVLVFYFSCEDSPSKRGDAVRDGHPQLLPPRLCFRNNPNTIPDRTDSCSDIFKGEWVGFEHALTGSLVNLC